MYNTYASSAVWSIRAKGSSLSYTFNESVDRNSSPFVPLSRCCCCTTSSCSCCSSCSLSERVVSINPRLVLYGLRQSSLIQWTPFRRRLVLGGGNRFVYGFPGYDLVGGCCEVAYCDKERYGGCKSVGRRRKERLRRMVTEESGERCDFSGLNDAEAVIALLSEEVNREDCSCGRGRNENSLRRVQRVEMGKREKYGSGDYRESRRREEVKRRGDYNSEPNMGRRKDSGLKRDSRHEYKSVTIESRAEEGREGRSRGETHKGRMKSGSCSSYYSLSSSGEFESDIEDRDEDVRFDHDSRKKSDRRLIDVSTQESESCKKSTEMLSRRRMRQETDFGASSSYQKQYQGEEEKSNLAVNLHRGTRKQHTRTNRQSESRRVYDEDTEVHDIHVNDVETASHSEMHLNDREENKVVSFGSDTSRENIRKRSEQLGERLQTRVAGDERISQTQRQSRYRNIHEEDANLTRSSVQEMKEQQQQTEERMIKRAELTGQMERFSEKSEIRDTNIRNISVSQSESQIRNQEEHTSLVSASQLEVNKQHHHTDQRPVQRIQSSKGSSSVSHTTDVIRVTDLQRISEKKIVGQENIVTSIVLSGRETKESQDKIGPRVMQTSLRKEAQKPYGLLSSHEQGSEGASSSQASLISASRNRIESINLDEGDTRRSQAILMPPASQLVYRGSLPDSQTSGIMGQEVSYETSESGYDAAYTNPERRGPGLSSESYSADGRDEASGEPFSFPAHEDALGSAHRSEQTSLQLTGEFVEQARHEASSSQEENGTETSLLRRRDSRRSSGGSRGKGPSDEMWVTDPSVQETPESGAPESGNAIAKKRGRSLWSVIGDVVRLRWSPRAGGSDAAAKSAGKSSPNDSVSSETWFSGREHDGSGDDNRKKERRMVPQEVTSQHQLEVGQSQASSQSQVEPSGSMNLDEQLGQDEMRLSSSSSRLEGGSSSRRISSMSGDQNVIPETDVQMPLRLPTQSMRRSSSSSSRLEGGSASRRLSSMSGDQHVGLNENERSSQGPVPETNVEMPLQIPTRRMRRSPVVKELSESIPADVSGSSIREQVEQTQSGGSREEAGSPPKDAEFKQTKLQRNKQVTRDTFDEWEEAYRLEAEQRKIDEMFMREALLEAKKAADIWEVPVGAVLVHDGKIIARGCNLVEELRDSTAHAEMICIREASNVLRSWRLADTTLYVTLEPCPMCAGAILQARINTLVWGAPNKLLGADGSWIRLFPDGEGSCSEPTDKPPAPIHPFHPKMTIRRGVLASECADAMQQFFQLRRKKKDKNPEDKPEQPTTQPSCLPVVSHHPSKILNKMHDIFHIMFCL